MLGTDRIVAMTRQVIASGTNNLGIEWRKYNDGALAFWKTDSETGKTARTWFCDGKGIVFYKNFKEGIWVYKNRNTGVMRVKDLKDGE